MNYANLNDYIKQEFPSEYLRGAELASILESQRTVTISKVEARSVFNPQKNEKQNRLVLHFQGRDKKLIIGKERAEELKQLFGPVAPQDLVGKTITLYAVPKGQNMVIHIKNGQQVQPEYDGEEVIDADAVAEALG